MMFTFLLVVACFGAANVQAQTLYHIVDTYASSTCTGTILSTGGFGMNVCYGGGGQSQKMNCYTSGSNYVVYTNTYQTDDCTGYYSTSSTSNPSYCMASPLGGYIKGRCSAPPSNPPWGADTSGYRVITEYAGDCGDLIYMYSKNLLNTCLGAQKISCSGDSVTTTTYSGASCTGSSTSYSSDLFSLCDGPPGFEQICNNVVGPELSYGSSGNSSSGHLSGGAAAGVAFGVILGVVLIVVIVLYFVFPAEFIQLQERVMGGTRNMAPMASSPTISVRNPTLAPPAATKRAHDSVELGTVVQAVPYVPATAVDSVAKANQVMPPNHTPLGLTNKTGWLQVKQEQGMFNSYEKMWGVLKQGVFSFYSSSAENEDLGFNLLLQFSTKDCQPSPVMAGDSVWTIKRDGKVMTIKLHNHSNQAMSLIDWSQGLEEHAAYARSTSN